jgi:gas vesicle protein
MGRQQGQGTELLKGALLGGILGGAAALLLAPKSGKELCEDIAGMTENLKETGRRLAHPFQNEERYFNGQSPFIMGGAVGAVIGAIAALLLAPQSGDELREALGDKYEDIRERAEEFVTNLDSKRRQAVEQVGDWKDSLKTIVDKLTHAKGRRSSFKLDELLDWAGIGLNLLQQFQKRR